MKSPVRETQGSALMRQAGAACRNLTTQVLGGGGAAARAASHGLQLEHSRIIQPLCSSQEVEPVHEGHGSPSSNSPTTGMLQQQEERIVISKASSGMTKSQFH